MMTVLLKLKPRVTTLCGLLLTLIVHAAAIAQHQTVSGKITSNDGSGLPGVNVLIEGTSNGTTTNTNGNYQITVPDNTMTPQRTFQMLPIPCCSRSQYPNSMQIH